MSKRKKSIASFFANYETLFNSAIRGQADVRGEMAKAFTPEFIESSPQGVACAKNDDRFAGKISEGLEFYRSIGSTGMNIVSKEVTLLDDFHAMAKVYWRYAYEKDGKPGAIDFHVHYFLTTDHDVRIFAYITGDEQKALKEHGLIEEKEMVH